MKCMKLKRIEEEESRKLSAHGSPRRTHSSFLELDRASVEIREEKKRWNGAAKENELNRSPEHRSIGSVSTLQELGNELSFDDQQHS